MNGVEREASVLGLLLSDFPTPIPSAISKLLAAAPESFVDERHGLIAVAIRALSAEVQPIHEISVQDRLAKSGHLEKAGGLYVAHLLQAAVPVGIAEHEATGLLEAFAERARITALEEASAALRSSPEQHASIIRHLANALDEFGKNGESDAALKALLAGRIFDATKRPETLTAVYSLAGVPISTAGNLTTITSGVKTGKSALFGGMMAATFTPAGSGIDTLGLESSNAAGRALVHIDTEQSPDDHWHLVDRACRRASITTPPAWLQSYCFTGLDAERCRQAFELAVREAAERFNGVHSVLLDGAADLVRDVNDPAECNEFVASLHGLAIAHACPIVSVLHFNPGTDKSRGHLGSQLERKSETNLRLDKEGEATRVWSEKQRRAPILKDRAPRFAWCQEKLMHVTIESAADARDVARVEEARLALEEVFEKHPSMRYSDLISSIQKTLEVSQRTASRKLSEWQRLGVIEKGVAGLWCPTH